MPNLEQSIRERAYHLWMAEGQPHGKCEAFWLDAQRDVLAAQVAHVMTAIDVAPAAAPKKAVVVKKSKGATKKSRAA